MSVDSSLSSHPWRTFVQKTCSNAVQYWAGHVANYTLSLWLYSRGVFAGGPALSWAWAVGLVVAGLFVWSIAEYFFHGKLYHGNSTVFSLGHTLHHEEPTKLLGMPWPINIAANLAVYFAASYFLNAKAVGVFMGAFWTGHIAYTLVHHGIHHWNFKSKWFLDLKRHHYVHHTLPQCNLGVTTIIWDRIFGTSK
jgi:sterol desaturase/sphingolipid hydroxylase (fatty acid hydroxylase superfamily)